MTNTTADVENNIKRLVDVFACSDGGVEFIHVRSAFETIARQADTDADSAVIIKILNDFRTLIDILARTKS